jgi:regulator of protease activity HflC (stomatin/prohibitin superfamily)
VSESEAALARGEGESEAAVTRGEGESEAAVTRGEGESEAVVSGHVCCIELTATVPTIHKLT